MYTDVAQWTKIREMSFKLEASQRSIARETGIPRYVIKKMLENKLPPAYRRRKPIRRPVLGPYTGHIQTLLDRNNSLPPLMKLSPKRIYEELRDKHGFEGGCNTVRDYIPNNERHTPKANNARPDFWGNTYDLITSLSRNDAVQCLQYLSRDDPSVISEKKVARFFRTYSHISRNEQKKDKRSLKREAANDWMHSVLQGIISPEIITHTVGEIEDIDRLLVQIYRGTLAQRNKALCVLAEVKGIQKTTIYAFLGINKTTGRKYLKAHKAGGIDALNHRKRVPKKSEDDEIKNAVFSTLHEPPSLHGINRTTWKWDDLVPVLEKKGAKVAKGVIRQITKEAGFRWRKARIVLTSNDPKYREKLQRVQDILRNLQPDEAFFSIDEFGPFAVKMKGGRKLVGPTENFTVPQWQKSKGCLIMTAALELSTNQVSHFYSEKKNTGEMIKMMELLIKRYRGFRKLWLSWDAASWHMSKKLYKQIEGANVMAYVTGSPIVDTAALPAGAQFLNVIESVFSGLARGVIHNSDYKSVDEAKAAIDRYFEERNEDFQRNPKRAGKKIWGEERVVSEFHEANNCKDPRYR